MIEEGMVSGVKPGRIIVNIKRHPACEGCRACNVHAGRSMAIELENTVGAEKGDKVEIELDDIVVLKGAALAYGVPLAGLLAGIFIGQALADMLNFGMPREMVSAASGIFVMIITAIVVRRYSKSNKAVFRPKVTKISRRKPEEAAKR